LPPRYPQRRHAAFQPPAVPLPVAEAVARFEAAALADAAARAGVAAVALRADDPEGLAHGPRKAGASQIVTPFVTRGPLHDWLAEAAPAGRARHHAGEWQRDWDAAIWPHATAGFFKVRQQIPALLDRLIPD
jgi:deoxyribodipyrimidine photo-lyase